jgi:hypothetical protein
MQDRSKLARRAARVVALVLACAWAAVVALPGAASPHAARTYAWVTLDGAAGAGKPVPDGYLGLSFELSSLPEVNRLGERGNLVALLRSLGPGVLRLGGVSADTQVAWSDAQTPRPAWAMSAVGPEDLQRLAALARRSGWRVLLTIGLAHFEPAVAAREAQAARAILGDSLAGIELGNEPNAYAKHDLRTLPWTFSQYEAQAASYLDAIAERAGSAPPLAGPDVSGSPAFVSWGAGEAAALDPALLTGHHYPLGCHEARRLSIGRLLSPRIRRAEQRSIGRYMSATARSGIPFRLDETGSVSCGGRVGVSNTFGAALWAVDYVAHTMAAGMAGINFHGNVRNCHGYSPLCAASEADLAAGTLRAQPEWYALLLDRALVGDTPIPASAAWQRRANVDVVAMRAPNGALHVLIVDDEPFGSREAAIRLRARGGFAAASVLALRAPSLHATSGVTLGDATVAPDGSWSAEDLTRLRPDSRGRVTVVLPPSSADLVTLAPAAAPRPTQPSAGTRPPRRRGGRG